ncbi:MAG TPA: hypothetical protein VM582_10365 [Candidatus Thermoplasmatota archaeon]|nr:hypothetical protein [Candidatus Thermoplasmatota archaeon]
MGAIPPPPHAPRMRCPRCGTPAAGERTAVGTIFVCGGCGLEWVESMPLDFTND